MSATPTGTRSPPTPAKPPSRSNRGNGRPPASAEPATSDCASRSAGSRTQAATGTPGPRLSTPRHSSAATSTRARSAPSDAPGAASCGNAGATTPHTTPRDTAHYSATSPSPSRPRRAPCPTSPPPSGWPAPLSPNGRPARAERAALIGHHRCCLDQPPGEGLQRLPPLEGLVKTSLSRRVVRCRLSGNRT